MRNNRIEVTENNIKEVMGLVKRFFWTNKPHNFEKYHNFDCGWREEIPYGICVKDWKKIKDVREKIAKEMHKDYYTGERTPISIELCKHNLGWNNNSFIRVRYPEKSGYKSYPTVIEVGDTIAFNRGSYLVIRKKWNATEAGNHVFYYVRRIEFE